MRRFEEVPTAVWPVYEFTYLAPLRYRGTRGTDRAPLARAFWERNQPHEQEDGTGESFAQLLTRLQTVRKLCLQQTTPLTLVFSHGLFTRAFLWAEWMSHPQPTADMMRRYHHFIHAVPMPNCAILRMIIGANHHVTFAPFDTSHLQSTIEQTETNVD